jgi:phosphate transport system ATP-binding protein
MYVEQSTRTGYLVEYRDTQGLFEDPREEYTKQYLAGEFS